MLSIDDRLQRQIGINLKLRRQLENCRKDVVEQCAVTCEENNNHDCARLLRGMIKVEEK